MVTSPLEAGVLFTLRSGRHVESEGEEEEAGDHSGLSQTPPPAWVSDPQLVDMASSNSPPTPLGILGTPPPPLSHQCLLFHWPVSGLNVFEIFLQTSKLFGSGPGGSACPAGVPCRYRDNPLLELYPWTPHNPPLVSYPNHCSQRRRGSCVLTGVRHIRLVLTLGVYG